MEEETALPASVRKQGEEADALHRKFYPGEYPQAGGEQTGKEAQPGAAKPGEEGKETSTAKLPETAKPAESKVEGTPEEWKQKYETLQGKYNAEVPQLHATAAALRNQLQESLIRIKTLEDEKAQGTTAEDPGKKKDNGGGEEEITDPTLKSFKEEYPDIFEAVKKMVAPKPGEPAKPAASKSDAAASSGTTDARQTMLYYLGRDIPDWKEVNRDPEFIKSLEALDPLTGKPKLDGINLAFNANDFTTVIGYFRDFKATKAAAAGGSPGGDKKETTGDGRELTEEEKNLAPPRGNRAPGGPAGGNQITVTPKDLANFYDEARRGLWGSITEEKYRKEEARLLGALMKSKT